MFQITARSGASKGTSWVIAERPLVFGRDIVCDIRVSDPLVSRRHCQIWLDGDRVTLRDLGSSNATFVNGEPVKEARLEPGDEVAVGSAIFLVARVVMDTEVPSFSPKSPPPTQSLVPGEPLYLDRDRTALVVQGRPRTAEDLSELFALGRLLSEASSFSGLIMALVQRVADRFSPRVVLVAYRRYLGEGLDFYPQDSHRLFSSRYPVDEVIGRCMQDQRGVLLPEGYRNGEEAGVRTTLVAPMVLGQEAIGALIVQAESPVQIYDEGDLEFLLAVAQVTAPYAHALDRLRILERENELLVAGAAEGVALIGESTAIERVRGLARDCARSDLNTIVLGETGTGKELVVRLIHQLSARSSAPLTVVNCAAIPPELLESELFGYERGAFTGAHKQKTGLFEESDGGTMFLDELCDLSPANQARLLRAIETGIFRRLGGTSDIRVNVRFISATNRNMAEEVKSGAFRRDLYHRLGVFEITIPPLRERKSDIQLLAKHFHRQARERLGNRTLGFTEDALRYLEGQPWHGNVRELRNRIERAMVTAPTERIRRKDLEQSPDAAHSDGEQPLATLEEAEKAHIHEALLRCDGNIAAAAQLLDIGRSTLYRKVSEYRLL